MVKRTLVAVPDSFGYWKVCVVKDDGSIGDAIMAGLDKWHAIRWAQSHNEMEVSV